MDDVIDQVLADGSVMVFSNLASSFAGNSVYLYICAIANTFSVNSTTKTVLFNVKEANNHSFSYNVCTIPFA